MKNYITPHRFKTELSIFKTNNGIKSNEKLLELYESQLKEYNREAISRFSTGKRELHPGDISKFSKLFGIRENYLSGIDDFRTDKDEQNFSILENAMHNIFLYLGYADRIMKNNDYNIFFPENTKFFIEDIKKELDKKEHTLLCAIKNDSFITLTKKEYYDLLYEITDFISFKLSNLFLKRGIEIPNVIKDNDEYALHPHEEIKLKDGSTYKFNIFDLLPDV